MPWQTHCPTLKIRNECLIIQEKRGCTSCFNSYWAVFLQQIVLGCDGANSVVADFLKLKAPKLLSACVVRGFTNYPSGHGLALEFIRQKKGQVLLGRAPVDDKLVFWFVVLPAYPKGAIFYMLCLVKLICLFSGTS